MEHNHTLTNDLIKNSIKDILYLEWCNPDFLSQIDRYTANSINYSVKNQGDYGVDLIIFDSNDIMRQFHFEFSEFVAKYWLSSCKTNILCYPLPNEFHIVSLQKKEIIVILEQFTNNQIANQIAKKLCQFKYAYSINSDGNDTNIFCHLGQKYVYIHAYGS